jgi:SAM-dependent methyltransferase
MKFFRKFKSKSSSAEVFDEIYTKNLWGNGSGGGSSPEAAKEYVAFVENFLMRHPEIKSVLDIGCGDWQFWDDDAFRSVSYTGTDVSKVVIDRVNRAKGQKNRVFKVLDLSIDALPEADLILCKDVLQHLPLEMCLEFFRKVEKYKHVVLVNDLDLYQVGEESTWWESKSNPAPTPNPVNTEIGIGEWRTFDPRKEPFYMLNYKLEHAYFCEDQFWRWKKGVFLKS